MSEDQRLCFRCEHRARFLEGTGRPRHECGSIEVAKFRCYMYKPVLPVILENDKNDPRPGYGGYFGCRQTAIGLADMDLELKIIGDNASYAYYIPKKDT